MMNIQEAFFSIILIFSLIFLVGFIVFLIIHIVRAKKSENLRKSLNRVLLLIHLPISQDDKRNVNVKEESVRLIGVFEQFLTTIAQPISKDAGFFSYWSNSSLCFEIALHNIGDEVHFYLAVPRKYVDYIEKKVTAVFGSAKVEVVNDYNIFNPDGVARASYLKLENNLFPLKTYKDLESDPLNIILNAMSKLEFKNEGCAMQVLVKPNKDTIKLIRKILLFMKKGMGFDEAYREANKTLIESITDAFKSKDKKNEDEVKQIDDKKIEMLEKKAETPLFNVNIRLVASAYSEMRATALLEDLESAFLQFENSGFNEFKIHRVKQGRNFNKFIYNYSFRIFNRKENIILNASELSSVFHFPTPYLEFKKIKALKSKTAPPSVTLPKEGLLVGYNVFRGIETPVRILEEDRFRHMYIIGQTGTGKSVSLRNMIEQDIKNGKGVCFIDPHGEDLEEVMAKIPENRIEDVVLFDPSDLQRPVGINMLEYDPDSPEEKSFIINELINIFDKLYDLKQTGGPMFEHYLRNALLLIMLDPDSGSTLLEVPRVFSDKEFRHYKLSRINDPLVKNFWIKEAEKAGGEASLANLVPYITSKFNVFLANDYVRPIIAQQKSTINFEEIINTNKIFLVNLSKGKIGEINSSLLGMIIIGKILMAAFKRGKIEKEARNPFFMYIDEFQNFAIDSISIILSEARKYKLSLTMAHQFLGQLPDKIKDSVFGNVGTLIAFRVGVEDAEFLEKQFSPQFDKNDLINLDNLNAYIRPLIHNQTVSPFNIKIKFPERGNPDIIDKIKSFSRFKYGRAKEEIDREIENRFKLIEE